MTLGINARPLIALRLATSPIQEIGSTPEGSLTIFPVTGGSFEGERRSTCGSHSRPTTAV